MLLDSANKINYNIKLFNDSTFYFIAYSEVENYILALSAGRYGVRDGLVTCSDTQFKFEFLFRLRDEILFVERCFAFLEGKNLGLEYDDPIDMKDYPFLWSTKKEWGKQNSLYECCIMGKYTSNRNYRGRSVTFSYHVNVSSKKEIDFFINDQKVFDGVYSIKGDAIYINVPSLKGYITGRIIANNQLKFSAFPILGDVIFFR